MGSLEVVGGEFHPKSISDPHLCFSFNLFCMKVIPVGKIFSNLAFVLAIYVLKPLLKHMCVCIDLFFFVFIFLALEARRLLPFSIGCMLCLRC